MVCAVTLPPIIMEVGNGFLEDLFPLQQRHFHFHIYGRVLVSKWETGSIGDIGKCQCQMNMSLKVGRYQDRYDSRHGQAFKRLRQQGRDIPRETSIPSDRGTFRSGKVFHGASLDRGGCEYIFEYLQTSVLKMLELRWNWQKTIQRNCTIYDYESFQYLIPFLHVGSFKSEDFEHVGIVGSRCALKSIPWRLRWDESFQNPYVTSHVTSWEWC